MKTYTVHMGRSYVMAYFSPSLMRELDPKKGGRQGWLLKNAAGFDVGMIGFCKPRTCHAALLFNGKTKAKHAVKMWRHWNPNHAKRKIHLRERRPVK
jgi:hypothetical protein